MRLAPPSLGACAEKDKISLPMNFHEPKADFKESVMEAIAEVRNELDDLHKKINEQSTLHIHANEVILTYGRSQTVELFLKAAKAKMRKVSGCGALRTRRACVRDITNPENAQFQVIVCEAAPDFGGHSMAKNLANAGIDTMVINDSEIFAIMARVNQVILPGERAKRASLDEDENTRDESREMTADGYIHC